MVETSTDRLEALITILDYSLKDKLTDTLKRCGIPAAAVLHGSGTAKSAIYDILGYGGPKKIVCVSLQTKLMADYFLKELNNSIDFSKPGTGIACTASLSSISSTVSKVLNQADDNIEMGSEEMTTAPAEKYHLIITIVNSGNFEQVMEAAKSAGATGGTLVHARGLGSKEAVKYLGITIQPEKDLVLIVAPEKNKRPIMESISKAAGLTTKGNGICFAMPLTNIIGLEGALDNIDKL
ncbi:MAG: P-II family nitrogen regulator [Candidatus Wallacebacter cryptica]|jgi:nitrogen regulatory protein PII|nr:hypothetical protein [Bacillota bacterium]